MDNLTCLLYNINEFLLEALTFAPFCIIFVPKTRWESTDTMIHYTIGEMPHLEHVRLGVKRIRSGHHLEMNFHEHHFSEITLIQHPNHAIHWAEGRSYPLTRGDIILMHPGKIHAYENAGKLELFNILYEPDKLPLPLLDGNSLRLFPLVMTAGEISVIDAPEKPICHLSEEQMCQAESIAGELEDELSGSEPGKNLRAFALFINLLTLICRAGGGLSETAIHAESTTAAIDYINRNFRKNVSIDKLAATANMSRRNFFRKFRELTGVSPIQYLNSRKLAAAEELLGATTLSISEIAAECGFCDSNYFSSRFCRRYGISPSEYRLKLKKSG